MKPRDRNQSVEHDDDIRHTRLHAPKERIEGSVYSAAEV